MKKLAHRILCSVLYRLREIANSVLDDGIRFDDVWNMTRKCAKGICYKEELNDEIPTSKCVKIVWQYWAQGEESAPLLIKKCFASVERWCGQHYKIIHLDKNKIAEYVDIPDYIKKIFKGKEHYAHFSDYVRFALLEKYGGIWIDATVYMTGPIPDDIAEAEFYAPSISYWMNFSRDGQIPPEEAVVALERKAFPLNTYLVMDGWWFTARPESRMVYVIKRMLEEYWRIVDKPITYLFIQHMLTYAVLHDAGCREEYLRMPKYDCNNSLALQTMLYDRYSNEKLEIASHITNIHKLTHKPRERVSGVDESEKLVIDALS